MNEEKEGKWAESNLGFDGIEKPNHECELRGDSLVMRDQDEEVRGMKDVQDLGWGSKQGKPLH